VDYVDNPNYMRKSYTQNSKKYRFLF